MGLSKNKRKKIKKNETKENAPMLVRGFSNKVRGFSRAQVSRFLSRAQVFRFIY
jgi:hypothetical protein